MGLSSCPEARGAGGLENLWSRPSTDVPPRLPDVPPPASAVAAPPPGTQGTLPACSGLVSGSPPEPLCLDACSLQGRLAAPPTTVGWIVTYVTGKLQRAGTSL